VPANNRLRLPARAARIAWGIYAVSWGGLSTRGISNFVVSLPVGSRPSMPDAHSGSSVGLFQPRTFPPASLPSKQFKRTPQVCRVAGAARWLPRWIRYVQLCGAAAAAAATETERANKQKYKMDLTDGWTSVGSDPDRQAKPSFAYTCRPPPLQPRPAILSCPWGCHTPVPRFDAKPAMKL